MINKKPLINFLLWILTFLVIIVLGISNVFADTYDATKYTAQLYDNYGPSLSAVTTSYTNNSWRGTIPTMVANSSGGAWGISSPVVLLSNHTYSLSARIEGTYGGRIVLSTYNRIGVGTTLANAKTSYQNNSNVTENYSRVLDDGMTIQFAFTPTSNGSFIVFPFSTNVGGSNYSFYLYDIIINDLGGGGVSQTDITNSLNNQTNNINSNSNNNRDLIIQNQNENAEEIQDTIDESLSNVCANLFNPSNTSVCQFNNGGDGLGGCSATINDTNIEGGYVQFSTTSTWSGVHSNYLNVKQFGSYTLSFYNNNYQSTGSVCLKINIYNSSKTFLSQDAYCSSSNFISRSITMPYNASYVRISLESQLATNYITLAKINFSDTGSFCPYGSKSSKLDDTNNQLNDLNNNITDDDVDSSSWANFFNNFTTNTFGLTSIIIAPLNLIQSLSSSTCTDLQIPLPYLSNKYLTLPCMSSIYSQYFGNFFTLYQTITFGIIAYWVCVRIFNLVKDFKNPEHDEIEVVDL